MGSASKKFVGPLWGLGYDSLVSQHNIIMSPQRQLELDNAVRLLDALGRQLIGQSLRELGWNLRFDKGRRRLGACFLKAKVISLSGFHADHLESAQMEEVIRHEIAHAVAWETCGETGHGTRWKRVAVSCGAWPERLCRLQGRGPEGSISNLLPAMQIRRVSVHQASAAECVQCLLDENRVVIDGSI
jgi:hypothetical protein